MKMTLVIQLGAGQEQLLPDSCCIQCNSNRYAPITEVPVAGEFFFNFGGGKGVELQESFTVAVNNLFTYRLQTVQNFFLSCAII